MTILRPSKVQNWQEEPIRVPVLDYNKRMEMRNCRHFNGYKPCGLSSSCDAYCTDFNPVDKRALVVGLGAMGAVLRATAILPALVRKYPGVKITWMTEKHTVTLLKGNPLIDQVISCTFNDVLTVEGQRFDLVFVMDKDSRVGGLLDRISWGELFGFKVHHRYGVIEPAGVEAQELYEIGLDDHRKFFENKKSEIQLLTEAFGLAWQQDPYVVCLQDAEVKESQKRRQKWLDKGRRAIVGLNTGCSPVIPFKKLTVEGHRRLIKEIQHQLPDIEIVLLGGPEDTKRNQQIALGLEVWTSPTEAGLRDGLVSVNACDIVFSGDSLGMHMAIALKKWVVAWFGPTCSQEIELYGRGEKVITEAGCHPCWKRVCDQSPMCYDQVDLNSVVEAIERGLSCISSSSRQPFSETFS